MPRGNPIHEYPTSLNLPPELKQRLQREGAKRGGLGVGPMIRLVITEWLASQDKRARKKKQQEAQPPA